MHQRVRVPFSVVEERHPQLVIRHPGDEVRLAAKRDAALAQLRVGHVEVVDEEVQRRAGMREFFSLWDLDEQADGAALSSIARARSFTGIAIWPIVESETAGIVQ